MEYWIVNNQATTISNVNITVSLWSSEYTVYSYNVRFSKDRLYTLGELSNLNGPYFNLVFF